jgi:hypothetical protein
MKRGLLFSHPTSNANARESALGMHEAELLKEFHTAIAACGGNFFAKISFLTMVSLMLLPIILSGTTQAVKHHVILVQNQEAIVSSTFRLPPEPTPCSKFLVWMNSSKKREM